METNNTRIGFELFCPKTWEKISLIDCYKKSLNCEIKSYIFSRDSEILANSESHNCLKKKNTSIEYEERPKISRNLFHAKVADKWGCEVERYLHCFIRCMSFLISESYGKCFYERKKSSKYKNGLDICELHKNGSKQWSDDKTDAKNCPEKPKVFISFFSSGRYICENGLYNADITTC